jgi:hypothetical protein
MSELFGVCKTAGPAGKAVLETTKTADGEPPAVKF